MKYHHVVHEVLQQYHDTVLIGLRGSNALGINSEDIDILIVIDSYQDTNGPVDYQVVSWEKFIHLYLNGALETVECLHNIIYMDESVYETIALMQSEKLQPLYYDMVETECFLVMKNQLKQIKRFPDKKVKFAAKSQLLYDILHDENHAALLWDRSSHAMDNYKNDYVKFRSYPPENIDNIIDHLWEYRNDKSVKKKYIDVKNVSHNEIVKYFS